MKSQSKENDYLPFKANKRKRDNKIKENFDEKWNKINECISPCKIFFEFYPFFDFIRIAPYFLSVFIFVSENTKKKRNDMIV